MTFWKSLGCAAALACVELAATPFGHAQVTATAPTVAGPLETERLDVQGGASYSHFNPGFAHQVQATNLVGWQGGATLWFGRLVGGEATVRGLYGSYQLPVNGFNLPASSNLSEYVFLFGPSFRLYDSAKYSAGAHVLVGGANGSFNQSYSNAGVSPFQIGVYSNQLAAAFAVGGWADYKVAPKFAVRFTGDYQPTRYGGIGQNEFFGAVGIVYKIGRKK